jgi:thiamine biosynthesis protein ThiS
MFVLVNGQARTVTEPNTLAELLRSLALTTPFAVARNDEFVPRVAYDDCRLAAGDRIDIVHPTVGG